MDVNSRTEPPSNTAGKGISRSLTQFYPDDSVCVWPWDKVGFE